MIKIKTIFINASVIVLLTALFYGCSTQQAVNPYPFNTAKIEYKLEGNIEGTQTVYIKGDKALHETHAVKTMDGNEENIDILYLELGDYMYEIDLNRNMGTKSSNPIYNELKNIKAEDRMEYLTKIAAGVDESTGLPATKGEQAYAGKTCQRYDMNGYGEICVWNGIPLYSNLKLAGGEIENITTAQSLETDIPINDNIFAIPVGVTINDLAGI